MFLHYVQNSSIFVQICIQFITVHSQILLALKLPFSNYVNYIFNIVTVESQHALSFKQPDKERQHSNWLHKAFSGSYGNCTHPVSPYRKRHSSVEVLSSIKHWFSVAKYLIFKMLNHVFNNFSTNKKVPKLSPIQIYKFWTQP